MSVSFKFSKPGAVSAARLCGLLLFWLTAATSTGRPIEFSEPASASTTSPVSGLGAKPADLPDAGERVFKPHSLNSTPDAAFTMKPFSAPPAPVNTRKNRTPGTFDRDNDWTQLSPEKILLKQLERDALKLPAFEAGENSPEGWSSWDPYILKSSRRNGNGKNEGRGQGRETNRLDRATDVLNTSDPFAPYSGRRSSFDASAASDLNAARSRGFAELPRGSIGFSPEALERKQQAEHQEDFKRALNFQTPGQNPILPAPLSQPTRGNAFGAGMDDASRFSGRGLNPQFAVPTAPVAPQAPGLSSLSPAPYTPPAKLKAVKVSAPRREF